MLLSRMTMLLSRTTILLKMILPQQGFELATCWLGGGVLHH
jgi:hypothetical protein